MKKLIYPLLVSNLLFADIQLYPLSAVYLNQDASEKDNFQKALANNIDDNTMGFGREYFVNKVKNNFKTVSEITNKNVNYTFVSYLKIPRISHYQVQKPNANIVNYFPVTGTFTIANMKTGEIIYSEGLTENKPYEDSKEVNNLKKQEYYKLGMVALTDDLMEIASKSFKPFDISTKVIDSNGKYLILDQGNEAGLLVGDTLESKASNEIKVIYADKKYAIATLTLGNMQSGEIYSKVANGSLSSISKQKVGLVENSNTYQFFTWDTMKQFFTDTVGENAAFSVLPIDQIFYSAQKQAFGESKSGLSQESGSKRILPTMFVKIDIGKPYFWENPTDKAYAVESNFAINSCALMSNSNGVITYSHCSSDKIKDIVVDNSKFSNEAEYEIVTKNAIIKLANEFSKNVKPSQKMAVVKSVEDSIITIDTDNSFIKGENVQIFHYLNSSIKVPINEGKVLEDDQSKVKLFFGEKVEKGDEIVTQLLGNVKDNIISFGSSEVLAGSINLPEFETMSKYIVAKHAKYSCLVWEDVKNSLQSTFSNTNGFVNDLHVDLPKTAYIAVPRYKIELMKTTCDDDSKLCHNSYNLYSGVRIYNGTIDQSNIIHKGGYQSSVTFTYVKGDESKLLYELNEEALKLLAKATQDIKL